MSHGQRLATLAGQLLATPNGQDNLQRFFKSWLGYDQLPGSLPNVAGFAAVAPDMVQETQNFIDQVVLAGRGGPRELLTASYTTPSRALASFYDLPAPAADYDKVERPSGRGIGVLAQGSLIVAHSHEAASSPTLRGLLVFERLLCGQRPQVPPNVPTLVAASPGVKTTRQRYEEQHMAAGPSCKTCHRLFDPIGFGFEHYDEAGATASRRWGFRSGYVAAYAFANNVACLAETQRDAFVTGKLGFIDYFASLAAEPSLTRRK